MNDRDRVVGWALIPAARPGSGLGNQDFVSLSGGGARMINPHSQHPKEAWALLQYLNSGVRAIDGLDLDIADGEFFALYPHMSVLDNIAYPLKIKRVPKAERRRTAAETGSSLQLEGTMERRPSQLSGGQQQRVALARAVAYRPRVFLFDEPLSNLDARLRLEARSFLKRLQRELGVTTVYVTHDQSEALALADRMAVMEAGRVRQLGTPVEVFQRPANLLVAGFIGSTPMNLLPATVDDGALAVGPFRLPLPEGTEAHVTAGEQVVLGARPEYTALSAAEVPSTIAGRVAILEHLGTSFLVSVEADGITIQATVPEGREPAVQQAVWAAPDPRRALLYRKVDGELVGAPAPVPAKAR